MGKTSVGVGIALWIAGTVLGACSSSSGTGGGGPGFGSNEAGGGSGGGSGSGSGSSSGGGGGPATMNVTGTDPTSGTTTVSFTGAATSESMPGVYCKLWMGATIQPMLEVLGNSTDKLSSAEIKAYSFELASGESRQESFTSTGFTVDINVRLINGNQSFSYLPFSPMGGMCTTSITTLTSDSVSGTFTCTPLPASSGTQTQDTLTMDFSCPLQP